VISLNERVYTLTGLVAPIFGHICVITSIMLSPWFGWEKNAISDLGHATGSEVAPILNFGLLFAGLLLIIYALTTLRKYAKWTSYCLAVSGFLLQLVAMFDEVYVSLHRTVSILFFISLALMSILYVIEGKSYAAATASLVVLISWVLFLMRIYSSGIAVPEIISSIAVSSWIMHSALKILRGEYRD